MTDGLRVKGTKRRLSLKLLLALFIVIGIGSAVLTFISVRAGFNYYIENSYITAENKKQRELRYINDLQAYIKANDVSLEETDVFSRWIKGQRYVYLMIYKDDELFYSSDMEYEEKEPDEEVGEGEEENGAEKDEVNIGGIAGGPTLEQLKEYAEKNDMHPIIMKDGSVFASVAEFTEYLYYDVANIVSLVSAVVVFALFVIIFFTSIIVRITRLAKDVNRVAGGDMDYSIAAQGKGEIYELSENVENMRVSILENLKKEREARGANEALITSMSHDIRTPLTVLLGYLDIMKMQDTSSEMKEYIKASEATALRLKKLSDDMFNYFLVFGNDAAEVNLQEYELLTLIEQMTSEHILLLHEKGYVVDVEMQGDYEGVKFKTDAPGLMRIIDNVFSNLTKYADRESNIKMSLKRRGRSVSLTFENRISRDNALVESNGIGLKTCRKLAQMLKMGFEAAAERDVFKTKLTFSILDGGKAKGSKQSEK